MLLVYQVVVLYCTYWGLVVPDVDGEFLRSSLLFSMWLWTWFVAMIESTMYTDVQSIHSVACPHLLQKSQNNVCLTLHFDVLWTGSLHAEQYVVSFPPFKFFPFYLCSFPWMICHQLYWILLDHLLSLWPSFIIWCFLFLHGLFSSDLKCIQCSFPHL